MKTLSGQWIGRYGGSNSGRFIIDIDDLGETYCGTAMGWDDRPDFPNAVLRFRTATKATTQSVESLPVSLVDHVGNVISPQAKHTLESKGILFPDTVSISLEMNGDTLHVAWTSSLGTSSKGTAPAPKTRGGAKSTLKSKRLRTWDGFKSAVTHLPTRRYIYRGQENKDWRLQSSFHRTGRSNLERYLNQDITDLHRMLSGLLSKTPDLRDDRQFGAFLNLAQHHGYPTPLLDWTWSPYVAAFFAFHRLPKHGGQTSRNVRIFKFDIEAWGKLYRADKLFPMWPNVSILNALAVGNPRAIPQQAISTFSNVDDIETYLQGMEKVNKATYLEAFDLPATERAVAMRELTLMGITAGSLFPGVDGACEALKEQNFPEQ